MTLNVQVPKNIFSSEKLTFPAKAFHSASLSAALNAPAREDLCRIALDPIQIGSELAEMIVVKCFDEPRPFGFNGLRTELQESEL